MCLRPGDRVRLVSPASPPTEDGLRRCVGVLTGWGLRVEVGVHALDRFGYLAGTDEARLADVNDALRDPGVRAVFATRGGKGAYRIADGLDFAAARRDPKPLVGFSENTILHLALWRHSRTVSLHGGLVDWNVSAAEPGLVEALRAALMTDGPVRVVSDPDEPTAALTTGGAASGFLMGGNLEMVACALGWALPRLDGAILLLEEIEMGLGQTDRLLTMLTNSGALAGIRGVALGQFLKFPRADGWTVLDVLRDRLHRLGVPVLGGLPVGHGHNARTVPLGTASTLDADAGTLTVTAAGWGGGPSWLR